MKKVEVKASLLDRMLAKLGFKTLDDAGEQLDIKALELNTADGQTLTIEREEGAPVIGDKAEPDGEWLMPDGTTYVIRDGVIVEVRPAEEAPAGEADDDKKGEVDPTVEEDDKDDEEQRLRDRIAELEKENEELRQRLENAQARTTDELRILNAVKMAGGEKALAKISSNYVPARRQPAGNAAKNAADGNVVISSEAIRQRAREHKTKNTKKK